MKSKYLDIQKIKDPFQPQVQDKNLRKKTKPKKSLQSYIPNCNQTDSDFQNQNSSKRIKNLKLPAKKSLKQIPKSQKSSPKRFNPVKFEQSSSNDYLDSNKSIEQKQCKKNFKQSRNLTENIYDKNFIGELNNYLNELKRSKLDLQQNQEVDNKNETLFMNRLTGSNKQKSIQNTLLKSQRWERKIKKQKSINRNLQKCIIQIQKVLWDRNDKLELLEQQIRRESKQKQIFIKKMGDKNKKDLSKTIFFNKDYVNRTQTISKQINNNAIIEETQSPLNQLSKISSRQQKIEGIFDMYSETEQQSEATFKQKIQRRNTQASMNIEKFLSRTLQTKVKLKPGKEKTYNKFQRGLLNDF